MIRLARLALLAYPRTFRRDFGRDYLQTATDLHTHGDHTSMRLAGRLIRDALTTAPTMRWENLMNSSKDSLTVIAAVAAAVGIIIGAPILAIPSLAVLAALVLSARRHGRAIPAEAAAWGQRWYVWLAAAAGLTLVGFAMLLTEGDDGMSTPAWAVWISSWLTAALFAAIGVGLGATRLARSRN